MRNYLLVLCFIGLAACGGKVVSVAPDGGPDPHLWNYKKQFWNMYSVRDDITLGEQVMAEQIRVFQKKKIGVDPAKHQGLRSRVLSISRRIAHVSDLPQLPYEVHVFDIPEVANAFCMPGGKIGVYTGLVYGKDAFVNPGSDSELAAVLGHEIAHATLRHVTRRISKLSTVSLVGNIASVAVGAGAGSGLQDVFNQAFSLGAQLILPSYSRSFEQAADQAGFYYMAKAQFNPQAAIQVWERAAGRGGKNSEKTDFFASHPASRQRAKYLKIWLPEAKLIASGKLRK